MELNELGDKEAQKTIKELMEWVNVYSGPRARKRFVEQLSREHPTLQQQFFGLVLAFIKMQSEKEVGTFDARTAYTVAMSKRIRKALADQDFEHVPLI